MNNERAIYIIKNIPSAERMEELAKITSEEHFQGKPCTTRIADELPEGQPIDMADQLETKKNQNPGSVYLIIEPEDF